MTGRPALSQGGARILQLQKRRLLGVIALPAVFYRLACHACSVQYSTAQCYSSVQSMLIRTSVVAGALALTVPQGQHSDCFARNTTQLC